ncbi:MAG: AAA family ATPase [Hyphomicrobiaceae bacterium]|nr:AAA family ATPase [Hyphomicrobiaceae bacterium]
MPTLIIVAGPNGAGKTSFANQYLPSLKQHFVYLNADEIGRGLRAMPDVVGSVDVRAARRMLIEIEQAISDGDNVMIETTLANRTYAARIVDWRRLGYGVALVYLRLPTAEKAIERVRRRVAAGGHHIPDDVVRRRFSKSLDYLENLYKPLVDEWYVWASEEGRFTPLAAWDDK